MLSFLISLYASIFLFTFLPKWEYSIFDMTNNNQIYLNSDAKTNEKMDAELSEQFARIDYGYAKIIYNALYLAKMGTKYCKDWQDKETLRKIYLANELFNNHIKSKFTQKEWQEDTIFNAEYEIALKEIRKEFISHSNSYNGNCSQPYRNSEEPEDLDIGQTLDFVIRIVEMLKPMSDDEIKQMFKEF